MGWSCGFELMHFVLTALCGSYYLPTATATARDTASATATATVESLKTLGWSFGFELMHFVLTAPLHGSYYLPV